METDRRHSPQGVIADGALEEILPATAKFVVVDADGTVEEATGQQPGRKSSPASPASPLLPRLRGFKKSRDLDAVDVSTIPVERLLATLKRVADQRSSSGFDDLSISMFFSVGVKVRAQSLFPTRSSQKRCCQDVMSPESTLVVFREGIALCSSTDVKFFHAWGNIKSFVIEVDSTRSSLGGYIYSKGGDVQQASWLCSLSGGGDGVGGGWLWTPHLLDLALCLFGGGQHFNLL